MLYTLLDKFKHDFTKVNRIQLKNLFVLIICVLDKETVCLNKLKKHVPVVLDNTHSQLYAHYKRLLRTVQFWSKEHLWEELLQVALNLLPLKVDYLLLDGTKWEIGTIKIHLMTLCVVYQGVGIPIYWIDLKKQGHSSQEERNKLLTKALKIYQLKGKTLIADREYIGTEWFAHLVDHGIDLIIRLKKDTYRTYVNRSSGAAYSKMEKQAYTRKHGVSKPVEIEGRTYTLVIIRNRQPQAKELLLYLLSTLDKKHVISQAYALRWLREVCFYQLKTNGFNLEAIGVKQGERLRLMMAITVFAYIIAILQGLKTWKQVKKKNYKDFGESPEVSLFRKGIDELAVHIREIVFFLAYLLKEKQKIKKQYRSRKAIITNFV